MAKHTIGTFSLERYRRSGFKSDWANTCSGEPVWYIDEEPDILHIGDTNFACSANWIDHSKHEDAYLKWYKLIHKHNPPEVPDTPYTPIVDGKPTPLHIRISSDTPDYSPDSIDTSYFAMVAVTPDGVKCQNIGSINTMHAYSVRKGLRLIIAELERRYPAIDYIERLQQLLDEFSHDTSGADTEDSTDTTPSIHVEIGGKK